jgi:hypothetical protein
VEYDGESGFPTLSRGGTVVPGLGTPAIFLLIIAVILTAALFFAATSGVLRIGSPRITSISTASRVDGSERPVNGVNRFPQGAARIFCCARVTGFRDTVVEARWYHGGSQVKSYSTRFGALSGGTAGGIFPAGANVAFYLDRPPEGWPAGAYTVTVTLNGKKGARASFTVAAASTGEASIAPGVYNDATGAFSVSYPADWTQADATSSEGVMVSFIAHDSGEYPPRFAVVSTDYSSAAPDYLNGLLADSGASKEEMFSAYSLGGTSGARRTYRWTYGEGQSAVELESIQVVMQGKEGVLALNCHSLAAGFDSALPTFNQIINSFRVR